MALVTPFRVIMLPTAMGSWACEAALARRHKSFLDRSLTQSRTLLVIISIYGVSALNHIPSSQGEVFKNAMLLGGRPKAPHPAKRHPIPM